ncbi:DUF2812 domain-containing protein [Clostridium sp. 'White wine YQ']|uniref:DUF2812 domain-containing protein n=1 Tax=Clostridium sp. 'White wine YQ' TaxID=3027474 RepID=UPI002365F413|nr:DUF2812 domain-containing protein [Clostridium sp. 'White wine YQ']MDD7793180.1 DUF2812 domain-containing protein [Clostridium sp. 'White wine YQ']
MKKVIRKLFWDYEREEKWLNEMAAKGYNFLSFSFPGKYVFEEGVPGEYTYRIELLKSKPQSTESNDYISFMEENEIECVNTYFRWAYFRSRNKDELANLYSDNESKIQHYSKVFRLTLTLWALNFSSFVYNLIIGYVVYIDRGFMINLFCSLINLIIAILVSPLTLKQYKNLNKLKKQRALYE